MENKEKEALIEENTKLKNENELMKARLKLYDKQVAELETIKQQFEEAIADANEAKRNFQELYKMLSLQQA